MNNSGYLNFQDNSTNILIKNIHNLYYLQRLNKINNRQNKYFNFEYNENKYKNKTNQSIDGKEFLLIKLKKYFK